MKISYYLLWATGLAGCQRAAETTAPGPASDSVVGTWQLTQLQSARPATGAVPKQELTLAANQRFQFFDNGQLISEGSYVLGTGSACSQAASAEPLLTLTVATPGTYAPTGNYTLTGGTTLVIDGCLAADGPRYTFKRVR